MADRVHTAWSVVTNGPVRYELLSAHSDRYIPGDCEECDGWHPDGECLPPHTTREQLRAAAKILRADLDEAIEVLRDQWALTHLPGPFNASCCSACAFLADVPA
jgi:hypothetical protein